MNVAYAGDADFTVQCSGFTGGMNQLVVNASNHLGTNSSRSGLELLKECSFGSFERSVMFIEIDFVYCTL